MSDLYAQIPSPPEPTCSTTDNIYDKELQQRLCSYEEPEGLNTSLYRYQFVSRPIISHADDVEVSSKDASNGNSTGTASRSEVDQDERDGQRRSILCQSGVVGRTEAPRMV